MEKALRHFWDAYLLRSVRHDVDGEQKAAIRKIWAL
jgi:hypothetical protein